MHKNRSAVMALFTLGVLTGVGTAQAPGGTTGAPRPLPSAAALAPNTVTGATVVDGSLSMADLGDAPRIGASATFDHVDLIAGAPRRVVRDVIITVPAARRIIAIASGTFFLGSTNIESGRCGLSTSQTFEGSLATIRESTPFALVNVPFATTSMFSVRSGTVTINLICESDFGLLSVERPSLTTIYVPGP
jgi:hypothetical protein